jgi:hypothetical protein
VERTITNNARVKGHIANATKEAPQIIAKSAKSGRLAIHKLEKLEKA